MLLHVTIKFLWSHQSVPMMGRSLELSPVLNQIVVTLTPEISQGDSLAIVGWLVKHYYHAQQ
jgi:hypothetical protein